MYYFAADCHKDLHVWTLIDEAGHLLQHGQVANEPAAVQALRQSLPADLAVGLEGPRPLRNLIEHAFADCPVFEISATWTAALRGGDPRPDKTDPLDAERAAQLLRQHQPRLQPLPVADEPLRALQALVTVHRSTLRQLRATKHRVHTLLTHLWQGAYRRLFRDPLCRTARRFFAAYPHPFLARRARQLAPRLRAWSHGQIGAATVDRLRDLTAAATPPTLADEVWIEELTDTLADLERLDAKRQRLTQHLGVALQACGADWLLQERGLGIVRAAQLVAAGLLQSPGPNAFARHAGIAPESDSSGPRVRHRNARRRHEALFQTLLGWAASLQGPRCQVPEAIAYYQRKLGEGKSIRTALRCLARRLIERLFRLRQQHAIALFPTHASGAIIPPPGGG